MNIRFLYIKMIKINIKIKKYASVNACFEYKKNTILNSLEEYSIISKNYQNTFGFIIFKSKKKKASKRLEFFNEN